MTLPTNNQWKKLRRPNKRKSVNSATLALVNAIMLAGAANAQSMKDGNTAGQTNAPAQLPDVIVKGKQESESYKPDAASSPKYTQPLVDTPQSITVVPRAVFEQQGATSLRDVLRNVSGISMQAGEGGVPSGDNLSIRGYSARTDLFVDGIRDFAGYTRDPFNFEQVEVVKGPASVYGGRGSTGGSVNMVNKTPGLQPLYSGSIGLGTDDYERFTADVNQPIKTDLVDGMAMRLNVMQMHADTPGRDVASNERWGVAPSLTFGLGTPTQVTLSYFHLNQDNMPDYGIPWVQTNNIALPAYQNQAPPVSFDNFYGLTARDHERIQTDIATAEIKHDFNEAVRLRNITRFASTGRDSIITSPRFAGTNTTDVARTDWKSRDQVNDLAANQFDVISQFDTDKVGHALVTGVDFEYESETGYARTKGGTAKNTGPNSPPTSLFDPNPDDPYREDIQRNGARNEAISTDVGLYAFDTVKLGEKFDLAGGLRWDQFSADFKAIAPNGAFTNGTPLSRTDDMLSWRLGAVYKPLPNGSVYFSYGTSFNPSAEGLTLATNFNSAANINTPPEESVSYELGTKWEFFDRKLLLSVAIFRTDKLNARTEDPMDPSDIISVNGKERVDGIELGAAGSITENWKVFGGYTFLSSEVLQSVDKRIMGHELPNAPANTFNLWNTYRLPWPIEIGGGARFVSDRFNTSVPARVAPSYWVCDGMATYYVNKALSFQLNVYNLTDERYIDALSGGHFIPGPGRSAVLTGSFTF